MRHHETKHTEHTPIPAAPCTVRHGTRRAAQNHLRATYINRPDRTLIGDESSRVKPCRTRLEAAYALEAAGIVAELSENSRELVACIVH